MSKLRKIILAIIAGLVTAFAVMAFTGPGSLTPGTGNPDFWIKSGYDVYYNVSGGNVGIGTASPDANYKITTSGGGIKAESTSQPAGYFSSASGPSLLVAGQIKITGGTPGADKVLTSDAVGLASWQAPSSSGVTLPSGAVFFMITGSCPSGTTDVSATYANKFVKINATPGTSSGVVLTGTTDSHTLTITEMPAHTHTFPTRSQETAYDYAAPGGNAAVSSGTTNSTGGDSGHTHTISSATTLEPSSITAKLCQVN